MNYHAQVVIERRASRVRTVAQILDAIAADGHMLRELEQAAHDPNEAAQIRAHIDLQDAQLADAVVAEREEEEPTYIGSFIPFVPSPVAPVASFAVKTSLDLP